MCRFATILPVFLLLFYASGPGRAASAEDTGNRNMREQVGGRFEIRMHPVGNPGNGIGQFSIDKTFHGGLEGTSVGTMLAARTGTPGSAGYVLIEHVTGTIAGRSGGFMLQHSGLMDRGRPEARISIIPDSGTGGLAGIAGEMTIDAAANHAYVLRYSLPRF